MEPGGPPSAVILALMASFLVWMTTSRGVQFFLNVGGGGSSAAGSPDFFAFPLWFRYQVWIFCCRSSVIVLHWVATYPGHTLSIFEGMPSFRSPSSYWFWIASETKFTTLDSPSWSWVFIQLSRCFFKMDEKGLDQDLDIGGKWIAIVWMMQLGWSGKNVRAAALTMLQTMHTWLLHIFEPMHMWLLHIFEPNTCDFYI